MCQSWAEMSKFIPLSLAIFSDFFWVYLSLGLSWIEFPLVLDFAEILVIFSNVFRLVWA